MFAEFELLIHETVEKGGALSGEGLNGMYLDLLKKYHGPKVVIDEVVAAEWAYIPHFYYDFYVYQYATSIAASAYFADQVMKGGARERDTYLSVLKAGGSDYPVDVLKKAGLDMTTPTPYRALVDKFTRTLDQIEALI
jgi:oligoendopeptidase F